MINIHVVTRGGSSIHMQADPGRSLMETLREGGIDDIAALCGGNCSCATCHVYLENSALELGSDEADMLDSLLHQRPHSKLLCHVDVGEGMNDLHVEIAPEE